MTLATARLLVGRVIVGFTNERHIDPVGRPYYDPTITLDNGARLTFFVQETDHGTDYGVRVDYHPKARAAK